ncbi:MAG: GNAT family N-acetyltransferase [Polyangiaceae bacterium]|nr:GNAT family N-acetyltransferase [Polyangiaceae bacterium]
MTPPSERTRPALRPATHADRERLFHWANDPVARAASFRPAPITAEGHTRWLDATLGSPARQLWIVEVEGAPVGMVRLDRDEERPREATVSINLAPEHRGRRLAAPALHALADAARRSGLSRLVAWVRTSNAASAASFRAAGYAADGEHSVEGIPALRFVLGLEPPPREAR